MTTSRHVTVLDPITHGQVPKWNSTTGRFEPGSAGALGGWTTGYELDFTSLGLTTASANGNFTIDSKTWTVKNFANSSVMSVGGTDGLRVKANSTVTSMAVGTHSSPVFVSPTMATFLSGIPDNVQIGLRVSVWTKAFTRANNNDGSVFLIETGDFDGQRHEIQQFNSGGTQSDFMRLILNSSVKTAVTIGATLATHDAMQMEMPYLGIDLTMINTGIVSGGAFPTKWFRRGSNQSAAGTWAPTPMKSLADTVITLGTLAATSAATCEHKYGRLRIEYLLYQ